MRFEILKKSKRSRARLGILHTERGEVETPALVSVATQAVVKTLTSEEAAAAGCRLLIANTFHLHLKPGEKIIESAGGLHQFMNWPGALMTDSGGFQVFSLGFGHDLGVGKKISGQSGKEIMISEHSQPKSVKITDDGVHFRSPVDGRPLFLGPRESIKIQEALGADIIFAFDECTAPLSSKDYIKKSLARTHKWAKICLESKKNKKQSLFGITQGSDFKDLRQESAKFINSLGFDGYGIGGDLGVSKKTTKDIISWTLPLLDEKKPRHLLGIGKLEDIELIIKSGIDTFDCTVPTHYARTGVAFTNSGPVNLSQSRFLKDKKPIDEHCSCFVCKNYRRNYISHLLRAREITPLRLLTMHNLFCFNKFVENIRRKIKEGKL
ncbi:MAG: tRNA guanosine(34) transglycosylase Tgt [Candidatus Niyogibacteria bacterium]|nr:MAG: tRNA guanosine(34) transglycosylase Tgt [Candidatus Niyogibacteria bacterium]